MMADIQSRIQKQRQMMKGFQAMRSASGNPEVQRQAESNIRDAQRNISYLEESLQALIDRQSGNSATADSAPHGSVSDSAGFDTPKGTITSGAAGSQTSFNSSLGASSSASSGSARQLHYPGDASAAYLWSSQDRQLPSAPGAYATPSYSGNTYPYAPSSASSQGQGAYGGSPGQSQRGNWAPAPVARMPTTRRNLTNLGKMIAAHLRSTVSASCRANVDS